MKVIVNNLATEYKDEGQGPIVLILHGWWRNTSDFDGVADILSRNYRVVRVDLPGFGGTETPVGKAWDLADYVDFVKEFIKKVGIKPDTLIGHSFGGRIVLKDQFGAEKLVLVSAAGVKVKKWRKTVFMFLAKAGDLLSFVPPFVFVRRRLKNKFYKIIGSDYLDSGHMKDIFQAVVREDLSKYAEAISKSTLIIWGDKDVFTPLEDGYKLHQLIKGSKFEIIQGVGHFSMIDKPEEVAKMINSFIK